MPLSWINRDARLIIAARGIRTFAQSSVGVIMALYLRELGFSILQIGAFLSVGVAGVAFFAFIVGLAAGRVGRRRLLITFSLLSCAAAIGLFFIDEFVVLVAIAFAGSLSTGGGGGGESPAQPLEIASLPDTAPTEKRTDLFAVYSIVARTGTAIGALAAGLPVLYQDAFGLSTLLSFKVMFLGFAGFQLIGAFLYSLVSSAIEGGIDQQKWTNPLQLPSRRRIFTLTGLFGVDTFTTSMVMQSLVAYWFTNKFGLTLGSLAPMFFFSHVLTAISIWLSAKLANRFGLLNTMVFTHIPSSLFLLAATFAPGAWMAILFWQVRAFLSQMDVPARDSYTMAVVGPEERVAMASIQMVSKSGGGAVGPTATTALWSTVSATAPWVVSAALKITYDLSLYFIFRNVKPPEEIQREMEREERRAAQKQRVS
ncbi:MAG: hypothetical protein BZY80_03600 [SAR202 cluster bacterium Io17-Chloro-G2]|nr:MAG: hypothetical protein BZY80_03600 [SAR202 cluster bacterium Io17-Chloro-G2]